MGIISRRDFVAASIAISATVPGVTMTSFQPGEVWLDTAGNPIQAHGGSVIHLDNRFYWIGENKEFTTGKTEVWTWGVRCYTSTDLYNWRDIGLIIPPDTEDRSSPLHPAAGLDRPHILYNQATKKFVCWFKLVKGSHQTLNVLTSNSITGPFRLVHQSMLPLGMAAGDFDLCTNPQDGKAYIYFERVHSELICADLNDDYTNVSGYYSTHFPHPSPPQVREGIAYFTRRGKHYLATSGTTGYFPSPSEIAVADTFHGPFTVLGDFHPSDRSRTSFNSQISCIFKHPQKKDLYIAMADRWMGPQTSSAFENGETSRHVQSVVAKYFSTPSKLSGEEKELLRGLVNINTSQSRYVWLPVRFDGDRPFIEWRTEWSLDEFE